MVIAAERGGFGIAEVKLAKPELDRPADVLAIRADLQFFTLPPGVPQDEVGDRRLFARLGTDHDRSVQVERDRRVHLTGPRQALGGLIEERGISLREDHRRAGGADIRDVSLNRREETVLLDLEGDRPFIGTEKQPVR